MGKKTFENTTFDIGVARLESSLLVGQEESCPPEPHIGPEEVDNNRGCLENHRRLQELITGHTIESRVIVSPGYTQVPMFRLTVRKGHFIDQPCETFLHTFCSLGNIIIK